MNRFLAAVLLTLIGVSGLCAQGPVRNLARRAIWGEMPYAAPTCTGPNCPQASPAPFVAVPAVAPQPMPAKVVEAPGTVHLVPLSVKLGKVRAKLVEGLVAKGVSRADATKVVGQLGDGHLLELLIKYGPDLIKLIELLLPLFMDNG